MSDKEVQLLDPSRGEVEYATPEQAQADFLAGKRQLLSGSEHKLIQDQDGTMASFPAEKVQDALQAGWRFANQSDQLRHDAQNQQGRAALEGAASALSFGGSDLALHAAGVEGLRERQETTGHGVGTALGTGLMMFGTGGLGGAAEAAEGVAARNIAQRAISTVLKPARALEGASKAIGEAGATALGEAGAGQAARSIGGAILGEGVTNAGVGAFGAMTEEMLGDPDANAESLLAAAGMGSLVGGVLGGAGGALGGTIGHALSGTGKAGRAAIVDADQLGAVLAQSGVEVKDKGLLKRAVAFIREDVPEALGGYSGDDIRTVNTPAAQRILRDREGAVKSAAVSLDDVVKRVVAQQEGQDAALGTLRPRVLKELIGPAAGGQALSTAGSTIDDIRAELQSVVDRQVALGLGEDGATKAFRKATSAVDEFEGRLFDEAGVPRAYTERTVTTEPGQPFLGRQRAGAAPEAAPTASSFDRNTQQELPGIDTNRSGQFKDAGWIQESAPTAAASTSFPDRLKDAINNLPDDKGTGARYITDLRAAFPEMSASEFDTALRQAQLDEHVYLRRADLVGAFPKGKLDNPLRVGDAEFNLAEIHPSKLAPASDGFDDWGDVMPAAPTKMVDARSRAMHDKAVEYANSLSAGERSALEMGASAGSRSKELRMADRNASLKGVDPEIAKAVRTTRSMLRDAPAIDAPLFRGMNIPDDKAEAFLASLRSGNLTQDHFSSFTYDPSWADEFAKVKPDHTPVVFRIESGAKGIPIGFNMREHEVILPKGQYAVKDIAQDAEGRYQVLLTQGKTGESAVARTPDARQLSLDSALKPESKVKQFPVDPNAPPQTDGMGSLGNRSVQQVKKWSLAELGDRFVLPDHMAARTFDSLDQLRQAVSKLPRGADPEIHAAIQRVKDRIDLALTDRNAFGKAADMQADMTRALKARDAAWKDLQQHYDVTNPGAASTYMDRLTSLKGDAAKDALDRWVSANQTVGEVADKHYNGQDFGQKARGTAAAYAKVVNDMRDKVTVLNAITRLRNQERVNKASSNGAMQYALQGVGMGMAHSLGLGGLPAVLAGGQLAGTVMNPGSQAVRRAHMAVVREKVGQVLQGLADQAMTKVSGAAHTAGLEAPGLARMVSVTTRGMLEAKTDADRQKAFDRRLQEIQTLQDPQAFLDHSTQSFGDLASAAPNHTAAMTGKAQLALSLLASRLPGARAGTGGLLGGAPRATAADLLRFALTDRAVQDPLGAMHAAVQRGMLLPTEKEALETVHPQLTQAFQQALAERAEPGKLDARAVRLMASFVGQQSDTLKWVQDAHQQATQKPQPGAGGTRTRPASRGLGAPSETLGAP